VTWSLAGSVALVTGGARGIGAATAEALARAGARAVAIADIDANGARRRAAAIEALGVESLAVAVDLGAAGGPEEAVRRTEMAIGPVELYVGNAGVAVGGGPEVDDEAWDRSWQVNVMAHVRCLRALLPPMVERGAGCIVIVASAAGLLTNLGAAPYSVTKHGAVALAEWLAITYGHRGVKVLAVCPEGVRTDLLEAASRDGGIGALAARAVRAAGPVLEPEDVADAIVAALGRDELLVLPHADVARWTELRARDNARWIRVMSGLQQRLEDDALG